MCIERKVESSHPQGGLIRFPQFVFGINSKILHIFAIVTGSD